MAPGCPLDDLDPRIDERRREKVSRQRSQHSVLLYDYDWSHLDANIEASLVYKHTGLQVQWWLMS